MALTDTPVPAVELARVSKLFGTYPALRNVSLRLEAGASAVLLGENGAGKSTLLRLVAGLQVPSFGSVRVLGEAPHEVRGRLAYMSHAPMLYGELTGMENLLYFATLYGAQGDDVAEYCAEALRGVGLEPGLPQRLDEYSQGMRQRASLARVLLAQPELLLLDEPFSNLDAGSARGMVERLQRWLSEPAENGLARTLLLTTHQFELARPLAKTTLTMQAGQLVPEAS